MTRTVDCALVIAAIIGPLSLFYNAPAPFPIAQFLNRNFHHSIGSWSSGVLWSALEFYSGP